MRWKELDLEAATLEIPAERYKGKRAHIAPLPEPALAIIRELPHIDGSDFVFPSRP